MKGKNDTAGRAGEVLKRLDRRYPAPASALEYRDPWELLVATVLAAQCTDERVNKVTPELFRRWPGPAELARADVSELEEVVRSTGFFRNKAKNLVGAAAMLGREFGGRMPESLEELVRLPGVARKTANIVLSHGLGINQGLAVDTHVKRLSFRLGFTESANPEIIERDLMPLFPQERWGDVNHMLVWFGREVCGARKPDCPRCELADSCPKNGVNG
jgi:endonuclease-3